LELCVHAGGKVNSRLDVINAISAAIPDSFVSKLQSLQSETDGVIEYIGEHDDHEYNMSMVDTYKAHVVVFHHRAGYYGHLTICMRIVICWMLNNDGFGGDVKVAAVCVYIYDAGRMHVECTC
jgi:hypothetical protein